MDDLKYYLSIFLRRLPYFLVVATVVSAVSVAVAVSLPPAYESQMRLTVESPQIPDDLAASTVRTPALEQLQIIEQRLLTRANLLDMARRLQVLPDLDKMNPDEIVQAMRARTSIRTTSGRNAATLMTVTFEAPEARKAAAVLNEYLTIIQEADTEFRRGRAGDTLEFFTREVARLGDELGAQSARIIAFKQKNSDALPESLDFRLSKQADLRERLLLAERDIDRLRNQRDRLLQLYETTGQTELAPEAIEPSPAKLKLRQLESELNEALLVFSEQNPRVKLLRERITLLKSEIAAEETAPEPAGEERPENSAPNLIDIQMAEIDSEIQLLQEQRTALRVEIDALNETIERTPEVSIVLEELERAYAIIANQYSATEDRLSKAQTGDLIESRSRGQRVAVIEQPNIPSNPTKPNRMLIAGGGSMLGVIAGLGLVLLLELLNTSVRRPEDLVVRFGISPLTTVPYIRTRQQLFVQRGFKLMVILTILLGIPALIYAVHIYYLPIDLVAEKLMNRL